VPKAVLGDSAALLELTGVTVLPVPPMEYRFGVVPPGDSGVSGVVLVFGLLDDRNLALADSVAAM
jgi:hypothetical protein